MADNEEKELTPGELYSKFGLEVEEVLAEVAKKTGYELKAVDQITVAQLARWEKIYLTNGDQARGRFNQWIGYVKAAVGAKLFVKESSPTPKQVDNMGKNEFALLFKAIDYLVIRGGQVDPNF